MYYGIAMTTNSLEGDRFLNCFLSGLSEFISYFISYVVVEVFGRRNPYMLSNTLAAVTIASAPFLGKSKYNFPKKVNMYLLSFVFKDNFQTVRL